MTDKTDIKALREALKTCDRNDYRTWPQLPPQRLEALLDQLEAERQRAKNARFRGNHLNEMLNEKIQQNAELRLEIAALKTDIESYISISGELATEVEALKAKLANPVMLSDCSFEAVSHMAHWYSEEQCEAWVAGVEHAKKQIEAAGGIVKDGE